MSLTLAQRHDASSSASNWATFVNAQATSCVGWAGGRGRSKAGPARDGTLKESGAVDRSKELRSLQRLVIADDEHLVAEGIAGTVRELGYEVTGICPNGEDLIAFARRHRPDLALVDIRLPGMNGLEAARVLFGEMDVPVVIVSAYADPEYSRISANIGVFGYLLKPITRDDLVVTLPVAWAQYQSRQSTTSEVERLKQRLEDRKIIERAKWILVSRLGLSEDTAMRRLQKQARDSRRTLVDVARSILESDELFHGGE